MASDNLQKRTEGPPQGQAEAPETPKNDANSGSALSKEHHEPGTPITPIKRGGLSAQFGQIVATSFEALREGVKRMTGAGEDQVAEEDPSTRNQPSGPNSNAQPRSGETSRGFGTVLMDGIKAISGMFTGSSDPTAGQPAVLAEEQPTRDHDLRTKAAPRGFEAGISYQCSILDFATISWFVGQVINRNVQPGTYTIQGKETLEYIATNHLGSGARQEDIVRHVEEIERINQLRPGESLSEGRQLILPGHTADGGTVLQDGDGTRYTKWEDGVARVERDDHSGYLHRPAGGGYNENHWGQQPEDNYDLTCTADGHYRIDGQAVESTDPRVKRSRDFYFVATPAHIVEPITDLQSSANKATDFQTELKHLWQQRREQHLSIARFDQQLADLLNKSQVETIAHQNPAAESAHRNLETAFVRVFATLPMEEQEVVAWHLADITRASLLTRLELLEKEYWEAHQLVTSVPGASSDQQAEEHWAKLMEDLDED